MNTVSELNPSCSLGDSFLTGGATHQAFVLLNFLRSLYRALRFFLLKKYGIVGLAVLFIQTVAILEAFPMVGEEEIDFLGNRVTANRDEINISSSSCNQDRVKVPAVVSSGIGRGTSTASTAFDDKGENNNLESDSFYTVDDFQSALDKYPHAVRFFLNEKNGSIQAEDSVSSTTSNEEKVANEKIHNLLFKAITLGNMANDLSQDWIAGMVPAASYAEPLSALKLREVLEKNCNNLEVKVPASSFNQVSPAADIDPVDSRSLDACVNDHLNSLVQVKSLYEESDRQFKELPDVWSYQALTQQYAAIQKENLGKAVKKLEAEKKTYEEIEKSGGGSLKQVATFINDRVAPTASVLPSFIIPPAAICYLSSGGLSLLDGFLKNRGIERAQKDLAIATVQMEEAQAKDNEITSLAAQLQNSANKMELAARNQVTANVKFFLNQLKPLQEQEGELNWRPWLASLVEMSSENIVIKKEIGIPIDRFSALEILERVAEKNAKALKLHFEECQEREEKSIKATRERYDEAEKAASVARGSHGNIEEKKEKVLLEIEKLDSDYTATRKKIAALEANPNKSKLDVHALDKERDILAQLEEKIENRGDELALWNEEATSSPILRELHAKQAEEARCLSEYVRVEREGVKNRDRAETAAIAMEWLWESIHEMKEGLLAKQASELLPLTASENSIRKEHISTSDITPIITDFPVIDSPNNQEETVAQQSIEEKIKELFKMSYNPFYSAIKKKGKKSNADLAQKVAKAAANLKEGLLKFESKTDSKSQKQWEKTTQLLDRVEDAQKNNRDLNDSQADSALTQVKSFLKTYAKDYNCTEAVEKGLKAAEAAAPLSPLRPSVSVVSPSIPAAELPKAPVNRACEYQKNQEQKILADLEHQHLQQLKNVQIQQSFINENRIQQLESVQAFHSAQLQDQANKLEALTAKIEELYQEKEELQKEVEQLQSQLKQADKESEFRIHFLQKIVFWKNRLLVEKKAESHGRKVSIEEMLAGSQAISEPIATVAKQAIDHAIASEQRFIVSKLDAPAAIESAQCNSHESVVPIEVESTSLKQEIDEEETTREAIIPGQEAVSEILKHLKSIDSSKEGEALSQQAETALGGSIIKASKHQSVENTFDQSVHELEEKIETLDKEVTNISRITSPFSADLVVTWKDILGQISQRKEELQKRHKNIDETLSISSQPEVALMVKALCKKGIDVACQTVDFFGEAVGAVKQGEYTHQSKIFYYWKEASTQMNQALAAYSLASEEYSIGKNSDGKRLEKSGDAFCKSANNSKKVAEIALNVFKKDYSEEKLSNLYKKVQLDCELAKAHEGLGIALREGGGQNGNYTRLILALKAHHRCSKLSSKDQQLNELAAFFGTRWEEFLKKDSFSQKAGNEEPCFWNINMQAMPSLNFDAWSALYDGTDFLIESIKEGANDMNVRKGALQEWQKAVTSFLKEDMSQGKLYSKSAKALESKVYFLKIKTIYSSNGSKDSKNKNIADCVNKVLSYLGVESEGHFIQELTDLSVAYQPTSKSPEKELRTLEFNKNERTLELYAYINAISYYASAQAAVNQECANAWKNAADLSRNLAEQFAVIRERGSRNSTDYDRLRKIERQVGDYVEAARFFAKMDRVVTTDSKARLLLEKIAQQYSALAQRNNDISDSVSEKKYLEIRELLNSAQKFLESAEQQKPQGLKEYFLKHARQIIFLVQYSAQEIKPDLLSIVKKNSQLLTLVGKYMECAGTAKEIFQNHNLYEQHAAIFSNLESTEKKSFIKTVSTLLSAKSRSTRFETLPAMSMHEKLLQTILYGQEALECEFKALYLEDRQENWGEIIGSKNNSSGFQRIQKRIELFKEAANSAQETSKTSESTTPQTSQLEINKEETDQKLKDAHYRLEKLKNAYPDKLSFDPLLFN